MLCAVPEQPSLQDFYRALLQPIPVDLSAWAHTRLTATALNTPRLDQLSEASLCSVTAVSEHQPVERTSANLDSSDNEDAETGDSTGEEVTHSIPALVVQDWTRVLKVIGSWVTAQGAKQLAVQYEDEQRIKQHLDEAHAPPRGRKRKCESCGSSNPFCRCCAEERRVAGPLHWTIEELKQAVAITQASVQTVVFGAQIRQQRGRILVRRVPDADVDSGARSERTLLYDICTASSTQCVTALELPK